ncbi:MAG: hypothetical protein A2X94_05895 [Bdellovibrionales bacterium GWB1_55_8]|nr:MAG: hypothetical protein A2X94_05895 [Bdellovibrionales bacterium GWB1_55_8]
MWFAFRHSGVSLILAAGFFVGVQAQAQGQASAEICPCDSTDAAVEAQYETITGLMKDWNAVVSKARAQLKTRTRDELGVLCQKAKDAAEKMRKSGVHMDVGLGADIREKNGYKKDILGGDPMWASIMDQTYLKCFESEKVCTGVKHFPGIGSLIVDPHDELSPQILDTRDLLYHEFSPFYAAVQANACSIMTTHATVRTADGREESCLFSKGCIDILRKGMGFNRLVVSDEIFAMNAPLDALIEMEYRAYLPKDPEQLQGWRRKNVGERAADIAIAACKERPKPCSDREFENMMGDILDDDGSRRAVAAMKAGNDSVLMFYPPRYIVPGVKAITKRAIQEVKAGRFPLDQLNASVLRVLSEKDRLIGKAIYASTPGAKSPQDLLARMSLEEKVKQLLVIDGRYKGVQAAQKLDLGGVYLPDDPVGTGSSRPKVPLLVMGDHEYAGGNRKIGDRIMEAEAQAEPN